MIRKHWKKTDREASLSLDTLSESFRTERLDMVLKNYKRFKEGLGKSAADLGPNVGVLHWWPTGEMEVNIFLTHGHHAALNVTVGEVCLAMNPLLRY
jgi:hypothetical protein